MLITKTECFSPKCELLRLGSKSIVVGSYSQSIYMEMVDINQFAEYCAHGLHIDSGLCDLKGSLISSMTLHHFIGRSVTRTAEI